MPEVLIAGIDLQQVKGRVSVPGYGDHDVTVFLASGAVHAHAIVEGPLRMVELDFEGPEVDRLDAQMLLGAAVRTALERED